MRMPIYQISKALWGANHARNNVVAIKDRTVDVAHRFPGKAGEMLEQIAVVAKVSTEAFGHGKDELTVRHGDGHVLCNVNRRDQHAFLVATRAVAPISPRRIRGDAALFAGERDEQAVSAIGAAHPGEAFAQVAAAQERVHGLANHGPKETVTLLVTVRIHPLELVKVLFEQLKQRRLTRCAPPIKPRGLTSIIGRRNRNTSTIGEQE